MPRQEFTMNVRNKLCQIGYVSLCCLLLVTRSAGHEIPKEMADAANRFLNSLDATQREKATYEFDDSERHNWHFVPMERGGIPLKELKPHQQQLAVALLHTGLSHDGFSKALNIMALEQVLREIENDNPRRDPAMYHVFIFGSPSYDKTWGWRVEGHHLSVSVTLVDGVNVSSTPSFFGANPAEVRSGSHKGLRVLRDEEDLGRKLLHELTDGQRAQAVLNLPTPADIINKPGLRASRLEPLGLSAKKMSDPQKELLMKLVKTYVHRIRSGLAQEDMQRIEVAGIDEIHFAWVGGADRGQGHYYRVQGPTFVLEYDNTQNDANHIHCVWRDLANDFGEDLLKKHYQQTPHGTQ
jgi:hypothetical protein